MIHKVAQGDCISALASRCGLSWKEIWYSSRNKRLRESGRQPNILFPGDSVAIPNTQSKVGEYETGKWHSVRVHVEKVTLHLRLVASQKALSDEPYVVEHSGGRLEGRTDGNGRLEAKLPADLSAATLTLPVRHQSYLLKLGHLDPASTLSGAQARLKNLGYYYGEISGQGDNATRASIRFFQQENNLDATGKLDAPTIAALQEAYGS